MRVQLLTDQEYAALLAHLPKAENRDELIVRLLLQCGLRAGEVCTLTIDNVWRDGHVHPALYLPRGTTKNHMARYVDMPQPVRTCLANYMEDKIRDFGMPHQAHHLFQSHRSGGPLGIRDIHNIVKATTVTAIFRAVNPHALRHTYATILLRYTNIRVVQMLLGHANVSTTQIYTHPNSSDCKDATDRAFAK